MTDIQMQFIAWLITDALKNCKDMDEVREKSEEILRRAAGTGLRFNEAEEDG